MVCCTTCVGIRPVYISLIVLGWIFLTFGVMIQMKYGHMDLSSIFLTPLLMHLVVFVLMLSLLMASAKFLNYWLILGGFEMGSMYVQYVQGIQHKVPALTMFIEIYRRSPIFSPISIRAY